MVVQPEQPVNVDPGIPGIHPAHASADMSADLQVLHDLTDALGRAVDAQSWELAALLEAELNGQLKDVCLAAVQLSVADLDLLLEGLERIRCAHALSMEKLLAARNTIGAELSAARGAHRDIGSYLNVARG